MGTLIVGTVLLIIIYFAFKSSKKQLKEGCGRSCFVIKSCKGLHKKQF